MSLHWVTGINGMSPFHSRIKPGIVAWELKECPGAWNLVKG